VKFTYSLQGYVDPLLRPGLYGLSVACRYVRHPDFRHRYPHVPGPDEINWVIEGDTIEVTFDSVEVLNRFSQNVLGDFCDGLAVPPGYCTNHEDPRIYATAVAHKFITQPFSPVRKVIRRRAFSFRPPASRNLLPPKVAEGLREKVGCLPASREEDGAVTIEVSPYYRAWAHKGELKPLPLFDLENREKKDKSLRWKGQGLHPLIQSWAGHPPSFGEDPLPAHLLLSLAPLGYLPIRYLGGTVGLCPDTDSFSEFDQRYREHTSGMYSKKRALTISHTGPRTAAALLAKRLGLPLDRTYHCIYRLSKPPRSMTDTKEFMLRMENESEARLVGAILTNARPMDEAKTLWSVQKAPLRIFGKGEDQKVVTVYDRALSNLGEGRPWHQGFWHLNTLPDGPDARAGARAVTTLYLAMETPMEKQIRTLVRRLIGAKSGTYPPGRYAETWQEAKKRKVKTKWEAAQDFLGKAQFPRIISRVSLDRILGPLCMGLGVQMSEEVYEYLHSVPPARARDLLVMGCVVQAPQKETKDEPKKPETAKGEVPRDDLA